MRTMQQIQREQKVGMADAMRIQKTERESELAAPPLLDRTELERLKFRLCDLMRREEETKRVRNDCHTDIGRIMRRAREESNLSLREVARRIRKSAPYLSDLELGRRAWSLELIGFVANALRSNAEVSHE